MLMYVRTRLIKDVQSYALAKSVSVAAYLKSKDAIYFLLN